MVHLGLLLSRLKDHSRSDESWLDLGKDSRSDEHGLEDTEESVLERNGRVVELKERERVEQGGASVKTELGGDVLGKSEQEKGVKLCTGETTGSAEKDTTGIATRYSRQYFATWTSWIEQ